MTVAEKPRHKIWREERLPSGWKWHNNGAVINPSLKTANFPDGQIVYLTSGLRDEKLIGEHIRHVMSKRNEAEMRQSNP